MSGSSDDDSVDLGISLAAIATIVDHARALQGREEAGAEEDEEEGAEEPGLAEEEAADPSEESLHAFINEMNEDEQASLIALAWTGRGDYGPEEWDEARALAAERNEGRDAAEYLLAMDNLGDLLAEGVAAFGLSIEEVER